MDYVVTGQQQHQQQQFKQKDQNVPSLSDGYRCCKSASETLKMPNQLLLLLVVAFCRRGAGSVARARGKREMRTRSKTRNYLFKGFYPFCTVFLRATGPPISLMVLVERSATLFSWTHRGGAPFTLPVRFHGRYTDYRQKSVINCDDCCI